MDKETCPWDAWRLSFVPWFRLRFAREPNLLRTDDADLWRTFYAGIQLNYWEPF